MAITDKPVFCRYIKSHLGYSNNRSQVTPDTERIGQPAILGQRRLVINGFSGEAYYSCNLAR